MLDLTGHQIVVVAEGMDDYHFVRGYIEKRWNKTRLVPRVNPKGKGGGNAWVVHVYPEELQSYRRKKNTLKIALVVITDGDGWETSQRKQSLEQSTTFTSLDICGRSNKENVLVFVPRRNIETWFHYAISGDCEEELDYKNQYGPHKKPGKWGRQLAERCIASCKTDDADWPSSLQDACDELDRH